jgi:drug/metabolite transporter (DMT)-like permease
VIVDRFSEVGLLMATIASFSNVFGELLRKQIGIRQSATAASFAYRALATVFALATVAVVARLGISLTIVDGGPFFGVPALHWPPVLTFAAYITLLCLILGYASWAHVRAFQVSAISTTAPLLSFTPVFTIFTGWIAFSEIPSWTKVIGILLIVGGTFAIHIDLVSEGWLAPLRAVVSDAGSRYMLAVALLFAIAGPIEKRIVLMSGPFTEALWYAFGTTLVFLAMSFALRVDPIKPFRQEPWIVFWLALSDIVVLISQYLAAAYMPVVVGIAIKRVGLLLIVLLGWMIYKERGLSRKLLGSSIMIVGALIIYFPVSWVQAIVLAAVGLLVLVPLSLRARGAFGPPPLPEPGS